MTSILIFLISLNTLVKEIRVDKSEVILNQNEMARIRIEGFDLSNEIGAPELPVRPILIALPKGAVFKDLTIISTVSKEIPCPGIIACVQPPVILSKKTIEKVVQPREDIYLSNKPYPENIIEYKGSGTFGNQQICEFLFYPVQYLPAQKMLRIYNSVKFELHYEAGFVSTAGNEKIKKLVINPEDVIVRQDPGFFDYMIITNSDMDTIFQRLAQWKTKKGVRAMVRNTYWVYAHYSSGEDNAARLRNYIKTLPDSGVQYILLAGDTDVIPCRYAYALTCEYGQPREDSLPCDLYYGDLQGDWNFDGDGLYGEVEDSIDLYPDLTVGRAPVNTIAEAQRFVAKVLTYEQNPQLDYSDNALFGAEILWSDPYTDQGVHKNMIEEEAFPLSFEITKRYESLGNYSRTSMMAALRNGQGLINHDCHGWISQTGCLHSADFDTIHNAPQYGIYYSLGCWTSAFDYSSVSEAFVNSPNGGGVAYIGNSSYGWGSPGNPGFGISDRFDNRFFHCLFKEDDFNLGEALSLAKLHFIPYSREKNVYRWHQYQLNLLGDPELPVWTDIPETLYVSHPQSIPIDTSRILITVRDGSGIPIRDALVCLMKGTESYARGYTDASGSIYLDAEPAGAGLFDLTVSAHNYLPFETTIPVISGPYVNFSGWIIDDLLGNSDGIANPGEDIFLTIGIENCGDATANNIQLKLRSEDPLVTVKDSTESMASLAPGISVLINQAFEVAIGLTPNGHGISFELEIKDAVQTLNFSPVILVSTPILRIEEVLCNSSYSMPSEIETLGVKIRNSGFGFGHATYAKLTSNDPYITISIDSVWYGEVYPESVKCSSRRFVVSIDPACPSAYLSRLPLFIYTNDYDFIDTVSFLVGETGFSDNMESGDGLWTTEGTSNLWHISTRKSFSPTHSWYCGQESNGQYVANMDCYIQTIPFMINANSTFSFYRWFHVPIYGVDGIYVIIIGNGFCDTLDFIGTGGALGGRPIQSDWFEESYSLSQYPVGETIQVRITFVSDNEFGVGEGFYIDDTNVDFLTPVEEIVTGSITATTMLNLFPNPFRQTVGIRLQTKAGEKLSLKIYDATGRCVKVYFDGELIDTKTLDLIWDGKDQSGKRLPAGVYFIQFTTPQKQLVRKAVLLR